MPFMDMARQDRGGFKSPYNESCDQYGDGEIVVLSREAIQPTWDTGCVLRELEDSGEGETTKK